MKPNCPHFLSRNSRNLTKHLNDSGPELRLIVRNGSYFRSSDSRRIDKFYCRACEIYFSRATDKSTCFQKKRRLNPKVNFLLASGMSQRRIALYLGINRKTVYRKLKFLSLEATQRQENFLKQYENNPLQEIQFDDLETSEHSKCKPLSVALAVDPKTRKILSFKVSQMPAKGLLAKIASKKYGYRKDERA